MSAAVAQVGSIAALWRYPVKSMQGEALEVAEIGERGLVGDRAYAIREVETGFIASAKHPRKWGALLACRARYAAEPRHGEPLPELLITLPDGVVASSADPQIDAILSRALGRAVALVRDAPPEALREANRAPVEDAGAGELIRQESFARAAPGTFFDYAPIHVLTTATLRRLQELHPAGRMELARFRPNILVEPDGERAGFVENAWLGRVLLLGADAQLHMIDPSPRCVVTTLAQGDLPHDPMVLRVISQSNAAVSVTAAPGAVFSAVVGVYGAAWRGGVVTRGARAALMDA